MKNSLRKAWCIGVVVMESISFTGNFLYGATSTFSIEDNLKENDIPGSKGVQWCLKPTHGGYCEKRTRTMIITNPEGRTHLFQVGENEMIGELRAMLVGSRFVTSSDFRLLYQGQEVLSNSAAKIRDEGDYLVEGDSVYIIVYTKAQESEQLAAM